MEDLDPPRESAGAAQQILDSLQAHGLQWDGEVLWQSQRHAAYAAAIDDLLARDLAFRCDCTRAQLQAAGGVYRGRCRERQLDTDTPAAIRVKVDGNTRVRVDDAIQSPLEQDIAAEVGDFTILRKDGLYAYQLAVVLDDAWQGITHVVRGSDLYDSTPRQVYLQRLLGLVTPHYAHIPVITNSEGQKLSKQNLAPPVDDAAAVENLQLALRFLGQPSPATRDISTLLTEAAANWRLGAIATTEGIPESSLY